MDNYKNIFVIQENKLTDELRLKCKETIEKFRKLSLKEKSLNYEELNLLLKELLENKNKNFKEFIQKAHEESWFPSIQVASILDDETEYYIDEIFQITNQ